MLLCEWASVSGLCDAGQKPEHVTEVETEGVGILLWVQLCVP